jgi:hypothetical protein
MGVAHMFCKIGGAWVPPTPEKQDAWASLPTPENQYAWASLPTPEKQDAWVSPHDFCPETPPPPKKKKLRKVKKKTMQAKNPLHNDEFTWDELLCWDLFF